MLLPNDYLEKWLEYEADNRHRNQESYHVVGPVWRMGYRTARVLQVRCIHLHPIHPSRPRRQVKHRAINNSILRTLYFLGRTRKRRRERERLR